MDLTTILIFIGLFCVACFSLFLIYKVGIKPKSYEEAVAEQRQHTSTLLGSKSKPKEKKSKKLNKKPKEKPIQESETNDSENTDNKENTHPTKLHVEFKEEAEEVITEDIKVAPIKEISKKKVKKVRPILVKKEQSPQRNVTEAVEVPAVNHFEENPPKDDFELLRSNSRDDIFRQDAVKDKSTKDKKQSVDNVAAKNKKNTKLQPVDINKPEKPLAPSEENHIEEKITIDVIPAVAQANPNGVLVGNTGKEKKKKKSEYNTKQQLSAERDGLINSVRNAELSKTEIQLLIDLLLNKQLEAPAIIDEWSEGKSDPIQKLKKQLAEKEKALEDEQQALVGAQAKLREIRAEQQTEKVQLQQKIRGLEEVIQGKHIEIQAANNRCQVSAQKIQQLQAELNAEIMKTHKLMEDNTAIQMKVQQYEVSMSQMQDTENLIMNLKCDLDELSNSNQHLQQVAVDREHQNQHLLIQIASVEKEYKDTIPDLQKKLDIAIRKESDWSRDISNLNTSLQKQFEEQRKLEHTLAQLTEQLHTANNEKAESAKIITQLKADIQQAQDELEGRSDVPDEKNKHEVEILNLSNALSSTRNELSSKIEELQQTENKYKTELETTNRKYLTAQKELDEQKSKNDELRTKNWKVVEALNAAENRNNKLINDKQPEIDIKKISADIISKEQESHKQFVQRLFPEIEDLQALNSNDWQEEFARLVRNYVSKLKEQQTRSSPSSPQNSSEIAKLNSQIQHYKNVLDDTEGILNKLQKHVEQEEINWRNQLTAKEAELESLKDSRSSENAQLQIKLVNLEKRLDKEGEEKRSLLEECHILKNQRPKLGAQSDSIATIEKLSEEVNHLREQLRVEQNKNGDVGVFIKAHNSNNSSNGPSFLEVPNVRNSNICSNMGCQFLYCDGNTCGSNL